MEEPLPPSINEWVDKVLSEVSHHHKKNQSRDPEANIKHNSFNYGSVECGAKILEANPEATVSSIPAYLIPQETSAILIDSRDKYMLNPCSADKWVIVELCEEIGIESVEIANFEFFSSMFKEFQLFGSNKYVRAYIY